MARHLDGRPGTPPRSRRGALALLASSALAIAATGEAADSSAQMQAVRYHEYGTSRVLRVEQVPVPTPAEGQVLLRVQAAAVNPLDWHYMRGTPYLLRMDAGMFEPEDPKLGVDVAGRVVAVGPKVSRFKPGDLVFGAARGSFAQYAVASEGRLAALPSGVTVEQAAALPIAALTALQGLRDEGRLRAGQRVLINGASGGVGTFAVQLARQMGAHVTGVCSGRNVELVRSLGAHDVVDYTREDFTTGTGRYDLVLDLVGNRGLLDVRRVLAPTGRYVLIGGGGPNDGRWIGPFGKVIGAMLLSPFVEQEFGMMLASIEPNDLRAVADLVGQRKVVPVIDRRYPLSRIAEAIDYLETGRARGKVIITFGP